ncbi:hypothetical protein AVEN_8868-1 [Araneus ventricosus]|uniref:DUF4817 domain-containing protein n=1 Tax=Araneus ventricosus TaxID=182803 RepID=A0A4Y2HER7_ARAVE|nr:hypothetical protein AVEN_8868-1 [Araneus ventricosus]
MASVQQNARLGRLCFHGMKSIEPAQRRFRLEYRNCQSRSKKSLNRWSIDMSNLREQEMCLIGTVLDDHRSQTTVRLYRQAGFLPYVLNYAKFNIKFDDLSFEEIQVNGSTVLLSLTKF